MARRFFRTGGRSSDFASTGRTRSYLLDKVEVRFWRQVQAQCRAEGVSVRAKILSLLQAWLASGHAKTSDSVD
jgi:hypothetical protein